MQQAKPAEGKITVILISRAMIQLLIITRSQEARKRQWHVPKATATRHQAKATMHKAPDSKGKPIEGNCIMNATNKKGEGIQRTTAQEQTR